MKTILKSSILTVTAILLTAVLSFNAVPDCYSSVDGSPVYLPNPDNPCSFYSCDNGVAILMTCPDGLCFNPALDVCDFPENVGGDGGYNCIWASPGGHNTRPKTGAECTKSGCRGYYSIMCIYTNASIGCTKVECIL